MDRVKLYLSRNLYDLRIRKKISQAQLAQLANIPRTTLSNFESGGGNPSLENLIRISSALQIGLDELLSAPRHHIRHLTADAMIVEERSKGRIRIHKLVPERVQGLEVDRLEIDSSATMVGHPHLSGAKEYLTVLQGEITVNVGGDSYKIKKGECLVFTGDQPHSYRNSGSAVASAVSVVIPVIFGE